MIYHTLTDGTSSVSLPADMIWTDEFDFVQARARTTPTLDGGQLVEHSLQIKGRPITLAGADDRGWVTRGTLIALQALASNVTAPLTLTLADGRIRPVVFAADALSAYPLFPLSLPDANAYYIATLKLIEA